MELYLLRHGDAADADPARGITDELRPLTPTGVREIEAVAEGLRRMGVSFDALFTSPLRRAVETAAIVARVLGVPHAVRETRTLRPGCDLDTAAELLMEAAPAERVLIVGHNPDLSEIAADLAGKHVNLSLEKGGLARVDLHGEAKRNRGRLVWLLTPEVFAGP